MDDFSPYYIAKYHVNTNDWAGIGYHYMITDSGSIFQTQNPENISYHAPGHNSSSLGVAITGEHRYESSMSNNEIIPNKKYNALVFTLAKLSNEFNVDTSNIISHESVSTFKTDPNLNMDDLRQDVAKKKDIHSTPKGFYSWAIGFSIDLWNQKIQELKEYKQYKDLIK